MKAPKVHTGDAVDERFDPACSLLAIYPAMKGAPAHERAIKTMVQIRQAIRNRLGRAIGTISRSPPVKRTEQA
jgi:hypothetical protein